MASQFIKTSLDTVIHLRLVKEPSASKSPLLVFLHYWGGSSSTWYKLTSPSSPSSLSNRYPSISLDFRGWGQSTGPTTQNGGDAKDYSISPNASDLVSVLEQLKTKDETAAIIQNNGIVLVGHSMGGKVALAALGDLPNDILGLVKGVVLVASAPPTPLVLPPERREEQLRAYASEESVRWTVENVLSDTKVLTEDDIFMLVRDSLVGNELANDGWLSHGMQEDIVSVLDDVSSRPGASNIKVSVLAGELDIVEQKDRMERELVQTLSARAFPVTFTVVKGAKHLIPLENPQAIARAVEELVR